MKPKSVTLYDVADAAGVSYQTVSRVINQASHVSQKTRLKVEEAMQTLNYVPNRVAQQLAKGEQSVHQIAANRRVWIQVVKGSVTINGTKATTADGLAIWDEQAISVHANSGSEILLFDLPPV
jgi:redox-sensitive bicupin YhaK (pirin superfamily)